MSQRRQLDDAIEVSQCLLPIVQIIGIASSFGIMHLTKWRSNRWHMERWQR